MARRIAVGVDGTLVATRALNWAADEAERRAAGLRAVYAVGEADEAAPVLASVVSWIRRRNPGLAVEGVTAPDGAVPALARESRDALLTVVGNRGFGAAGGLLASSVGQGLAGRALGPVAVVRGGRTTGRDVLLGLEGEGEGDEEAASWAFREASLRGARLRVLHAWDEAGAGGPRGRLAAPTADGGEPGAWRGPVPGYIPEDGGPGAWRGSVPGYAPDGGEPGAARGSVPGYASDGGEPGAARGSVPGYASDGGEPGAARGSVPGDARYGGEPGARRGSVPGYTPDGGEPGDWSDSVPGYTPDGGEPGVRRGPVAGDVLARLRARYPDVAVETGAVLGGATHALLDATHDAALVVVATHRRTGARNPRTGPVTRALLQGSHCPVILVPSGRAGRNGPPSAAIMSGGGTV
jgi:nucleotide-binding universal stress UspA family protein